MRIINVIPEPGKNLPENCINYSYKKIKYIESSEDSYIYEFKYLNSGLKLILILDTSEVFWLMTGGKYLVKFEKALDRAFYIYMKNIENWYQKGRNKNNEN